MPQEDGETSAPPGGFPKKLVARRASRRFQRLFGLAGESGYICPAELELAVKFCGQPFDEFRIGLARTSAQLMIEVAHDKPSIAQLVELMQKSNRISPAGDTDQVGLIGRKLVENP